MQRRRVQIGFSGGYVVQRDGHAIPPELEFSTASALTVVGRGWRVPVIRRNMTIQEFGLALVDYLAVAALPRTDIGWAALAICKSQGRAIQIYEQCK